MSNYSPNHRIENLNQKTVLRFLTTGGTIEKTYDEREGTLENRESAVREWILGGLRLPYLEVQVRYVMSKDSLHMALSDRQFICDVIREEMLQVRPIIVLHGTDTVDQTMLHCFRSIEEFKVPVIFTGAMRPLELVDSDARQNVIEAMSASQLLPPGLYLSFHGRLFSGPWVRKNRVLKTFEAIASYGQGPSL